MTTHAKDYMTNMDMYKTEDWTELLAACANLTHANHDDTIIAVSRNKILVRENAYYVDIHSDEFHNLSPAFVYQDEHGHPLLPVPGFRGVFSYTLEGIWQGLMVRKNGVDFTMFSEPNIVNAHRHGFSQGFWWQTEEATQVLISHDEAFQRMFVPIYRFLLLTFCVDTIALLYAQKQQRDIVLVDCGTNDDRVSPARIIEQILLELEQQCINEDEHTQPLAALEDEHTLVDHDEHTLVDEEEAYQHTLVDENEYPEEQTILSNGHQAMTEEQEQEEEHAKEEDDEEEYDFEYESAGSTFSEDPSPPEQSSPHQEEKEDVFLAERLFILHHPAQPRLLIDLSMDTDEEHFVECPPKRMRMEVA